MRWRGRASWALRSFASSGLVSSRIYCLDFAAGQTGTCEPQGDDSCLEVIGTRVTRTHGRLSAEQRQDGYIDGECERWRQSRAAVRHDSRVDLGDGPTSAAGCTGAETGPAEWP